MFTKYAGVVFGLIGAITIVVIGVVLASREQLSAGLIGGVALISLLITVVIAAGAGRQAIHQSRNATIEGAIVGFFMTLGTIISNMTVAASPAYEKVLNNLPSGEGSLQITGFELSPGSVIGSLLINVLIATAVATVAGRFFGGKKVKGVSIA